MAHEISDHAALQPEPLVSVYMLAYKHERFIAQAIEGIVAQRCAFPFELIIGEDCSPDATREIAISYQVRHPDLIRIITSDRNVGAHANAFRCRTACRGRYIALCEGDDFWCDPGKLHHQVALMESQPSMSACHTDFNRLTRFGTRRGVHRNAGVRPAEGEAYGALLKDWTVMTATSMYRRDIMLDFMRSPFYNREWPFGDLNLLLYASLNGKIGYIDRITATFRKVRGSASNSGIEARLRMRRAHSECVDRFVDAYPPPSLEAAHAAKRVRRSRVYDAAILAGDVASMEECRKWLLDNGCDFDEQRHRRWSRMIRLGWPHRLVVGMASTFDRYLSAV